jgi:hypothetical protein
MKCILISLIALTAYGQTDPLAEAVRKGGTQACLEAGERGRTDLIPLLEAVARECDRRTILACSAPRQALAKLGVKPYLDEIIGELLSTTDSAAYEEEFKQHGQFYKSSETARADIEYKTKILALKKLAYIRDLSSVKAIASVLYDTTDWEAMLPKSDDVLYTSVAQAAAQALWQMKLDNPPPGIPMWDAKAWQQWWQQNKEHFEKRDYTAVTQLQPASTSSAQPKPAAAPASQPVAPTSPVQATAPSPLPVPVAKPMPSEQSTSSSSSRIPVIVTAVLVAAVALWLLARKRSAHS